MPDAREEELRVVDSSLDPRLPDNVQVLSKGPLTTGDVNQAREAAREIEAGQQQELLAPEEYLALGHADPGGQI